ncbi:30S ribosomal protein S20 [Patescibacteria group bacterium]|nr:30S ribosomal protein S20 [Patescibacteria group bacterium]
MPTTKAAAKHQRQTVKQTARNRGVKNRIKAALKLARKSIAAKDKTKAAADVKKAIKLLDKAAQNKVFKKNTASRHKSRLSHQFNKIK